MNAEQQLGPLIQSSFIDHLVTVKGPRPSSVRSYSDTVRLLLCFVAARKGTKITKLSLENLSLEHVLGFINLSARGRRFPDSGRTPGPGPFWHPACPRR